ncbi:DsbA family protein [Sanguibacter sp. HDW7]|uniref:DsbA family oxidoreductase n=1 Tax=Sanguibacter sp. HDW7 TaxID=2714931 RepID=UPI00140D8332|nr:DsbA family oxidoreductase [Sanguibacter sp. HDW7]QIK84071.1 DsbA family oxidoreductase [Sanguibacter sp. HDW7]
MKVELWEDIVCSWCGIADERMKRALEIFGDREGLEFTHRSFRLLPELQEGEGVDFVDYMSAARGITKAMADEMVAPLQQLAREVGLAEYHVTDNEIGNTTLTHEFLAWASAQGRQNEAWSLLFHAHFGDRAPIWSIDDLVPFAERLGLDSAEARRSLEAREYRAQVEGDHAEAVALGSRGVPFLVIDRKYGLSGAQKVDVIVDALETAWAERGASAT